MYSFAFLDRVLTVATRDEWAARLLERAFAPMMRPTPAAVGHATAIESGNGFEDAFKAVRQTFADFAVLAGNGYALYGACGALEDTAFALLGPTTAGKTTLLLHLAALGARFCADETFVLDPHEGTIAGLPRLPCVREPALRMLPPVIAQAIPTSEDFVSFDAGRLWYALQAQHLNGIVPDAKPRKLRTLVFIDGRAERAQIAPLTPHEILERTVARLYRKPHSLAALAAIRAAVRGVPGYLLTLGQPERTARLLFERLCA